VHIKGNAMGGVAESTPLASKSEETSCCGNSMKMLTLWSAFILFSLFASAELVGYVISHSYMLLGDALAMLIDAATYLLNVRAEVTQSPFWHNCAVLGSVAGLVGVAIVMTVLGTMRLFDDESGVLVDWRWALGFSVGNLVLDSVLITQCVCVHCMPSALQNPAVVRYDGDQNAPAATPLYKDLNFMSALVHIVTDSMRAAIATTCAILMWYKLPREVDPLSEEPMIDATGALIGAGLTLAAAIGILITYSILPDPFAEESKAIRSAP